MIRNVGSERHYQNAATSQCNYFQVQFTERILAQLTGKFNSTPKSSVITEILQRHRIRLSFNSAVLCLNSVLPLRNYLEQLPPMADFYLC